MLPMGRGPIQFRARTLGCDEKDSEKQRVMKSVHSAGVLEYRI